MIARSALKDLRRTASPAPDATGFHAVAAAPSAARRPTPGWSSSAAAASTPGERFDLIGGLSIGRSKEADVRIDDRYASGIHARVFTATGASSSRT